MRSPETGSPLEVLLERFDPGVMDLVDGPARVRVRTSASEQDIELRDGSARAVTAGASPDAVISADDATWDRITSSPHDALLSFRAGRLRVERNLHIGIGFLAATTGNRDAGSLRFSSPRTAAGRLSVMEAGIGRPLVCLPGLGGTKASFLTTIAAMAPSRRVIAVDLPGFGDSAKPLNGRYDAPWFADTVVELLDQMGLDRVDLIGNSMGGRVALELGMSHPDRTRKLVLLSPAMAWLRRDPLLSWLLRLPVSRLGIIQPTPRTLVEPVIRRLVGNTQSSWVRAGVHEFLRGYCTAGGRYAFYESARNIFRDPPHGDTGFWRRLRELSGETLFVWGLHDRLVPIAFMKHVEEALPNALHLELDCGHVPQLEAPEWTHWVTEQFLDSAARPLPEATTQSGTAVHAPSATKRRISHFVANRLNPVVRPLLAAGIFRRSQALLETTGRRSGRLRQALLRLVDPQKPVVRIGLDETP